MQKNKNKHFQLAEYLTHSKDEKKKSIKVSDFAKVK